MEILKGQNLLEFAECFKTDEDCKKYLSDLKWKEGFLCRKCVHTASQIRKDFSRTCNICSHTESSSANTLFHKCKFGLRKAFFICFEMASPVQAQEMHKFIRETIQERYGNELAEQVSILYGGSVKPDNAKEIFSQPDVDGGLIGGASLNAADFIGIINGI